MREVKVRYAEIELITVMYENGNMDEACKELLGRGFRVRFADHHRATLDIVLGVKEVWLDLLPLNTDVLRIRGRSDETAREAFEAL